MRAVSLLSIIARIRPQIWDYVVPHGPPIRFRRGEASLNPQPLPPGPDGVLAGAAEMAHELVHLAVIKDLEGESPAGMLSELIDDWCGTPWPRKWPWPWPGPGPKEGPQPDPWVVDTARIIGAVIFADAATRLGEGELSKALLDGAEKLAEVAAPG